MKKSNNSDSKKPLSPEEAIRLHREKRWEEEAHLFDESDQRALRALQYQNTPLEHRFERLQRRMHQPEPRVRRLPVRLAIAASFLLLLSAGFFLLQQQNNSEQLYTEHFFYLPSAIDLEGTERGQRTAFRKAEGLLRQAVEAYESGDHAASEQLFRAYLAQHEEDREAAFYYGILLLGKGQAAASQPIFQSVIDQPPRAAYERPAKWYLALSHLKLGQETKAQPLLQELMQGEDRYAKRARRVYEGL